jgi:hypothetical protein
MQDSGAEVTVQLVILAQNANPLGGIFLVMSTLISYQMVESSFRHSLRQD